MNKGRFALGLLIGSLAVPALAEPAEWKIDAGHTRVGFAAEHMVVSEVEGNFREFSGKVLLDEQDLTKSSVELSIDVASVNTDLAKRDEHLRSADFFDAAKFPAITFKSKAIKRVGKKYKVTGELTIRGVAKSVTLDAEISEAVQNPWGQTVRAVKVSGEINRQDFGVSWNKSLDKGGLLVGDNVALEIRMELNK